MVDKFEKTEQSVQSEFDSEIRVFVYGTLMRGNSDYEQYLSGSKFAGDFIAEGFQLFDFGSYPRIIHSEIDKVKGEMYIVDSNTLNKLDILEREGNFYIRKLINVVNDKNEVQEAFTYVYNKDVSKPVKASFENQPHGPIKRNDYVWYASYGSNMLYERFLNYIKGGDCKLNGAYYKGCRNKALPKDSRPITIPYKMYYGNESSSWGNGGVSFLDTQSNQQALGRMFLVTREQFEDIAIQEGCGEDWYNLKLSLGEYNGIEIFTFTNKIKRAANKPADKYLGVVKMGIKETYPNMSDFDIMEYLVQCGLS